jgi:hypothetical protein
MWPDLLSNLGSWGEKSATNRLNYGTALTKQVTIVETEKMRPAERWKYFIWVYKNIIPSKFAMVFVYETHLLPI